MASGNLQPIYFFADHKVSGETAEAQTTSAATSRSQSRSSGSDTITGSSSSGSLNPNAVDFTPANGLPPPPTASQLFELRKIEGRSMGLVATSYIPIGTRIICEAPLLRIDNNSVDLAWGPYCRLSNAHKKAFDSMHIFKPEYMDLERASRNSLIDHNDASMDEDDVDELVQEQVRVMGTFACNNFQCGQGLAVFETTSRLNHSCVPNVHHSWNPTLQKETVHAVRDIQLGEELCTTYLGGAGGYCVRAQRIEQLRQNYGFTCTCIACSDTTGHGDGRREAMADLAYGLQLFVEGKFQQAPYAPKSAQEALQHTENLIELLIMEGLVTIELCKAYRMASGQAMAIGDLDKAMEYAFNEKEVERNCLGKELTDLDKIKASAQCWIDQVREAASRANVQLSDRFRSKNKRGGKTAGKKRKQRKDAEKAAEKEKAEVESRMKAQEEKAARKKETKEQERKKKEFETAWPALKRAGSM